MRKFVIAVAIGILIGQMFSVGTIQAVQSGLSVPVTYTIYDGRGRPLSGSYEIVITRVGGRILGKHDQIKVSGRTNDKGYICTRVLISCPLAIANVLAPWLR